MSVYSAYRSVDVSSYQGIIDFAKMKESGVRAVIVRAGLGETADRYLFQNTNGAKSAGMTVGAYYVPYVSTLKNITNATIRKDAETSAKICAGLLNGCKLDLPVFVDWEYSQDDYFQKQTGMVLTTSGRTLFVSGVMENLKKYGYTPGIYTNPDYLYSKLTKGAFSKYPLFLAQWQKHGTEVRAASVPQTFGMPMVWQYDYGRVPGCSIDVDLGWYFVEK